MNKQAGYTLHELIILVGMLVVMTFFGFCIYVVAHFIMKFW